MSKGISSIIVAILILMVSVSLISVFYLWATGIGFDIYPGEELEGDYQQARSCINLENADLT